MSDSATPPIVNRSSPATAVDLPAKTPPNPSSAPTTTASSPKPLRHTPPHIESTTKLARNVSPGLLARMKFLNQINENTNKNAVDVGRIEQDRLRRLDEFRKARSLDIERRGTAWSGRAGQDGAPSQRASPLVPQSTGESVPTLLMEPDFMSDHSSVVSTSDKVLPSESDADVELDMQKYRLPDVTKPEKALTQTMSATETTTESATQSPTTITAHTTHPTSTTATATATATTTTTMAVATDTEPTAAPTPPPKDTPPLPLAMPIADMLDEPSVLDDNNGIDIESYFQRRHYARAGSIYTLSKASFTNQIQQLTSMKLPPTTIASEITALPSSTLAGRALHKAGNDIRLWITKTKEVLSGLDAEDDVEWAAAAGREGLAEVDTAIGKFEGLVNVYICAIEDLQSRPDIALLPAKDQTTLVSQMEDIVMNWGQIKQTLRGIKNQVEVAMEWEELWNNVLGEIGVEVENLSRLVFEMEERRHRVISDSVAEAPEKFDISELETIVEELPRKQAMLNSKRFSMPPALAVVSPISPIPQIEQENSRLLALFAKLQPLRASLDFLPMRLNTFQMRARSIFPSACDELLRRKEQLEAQEKKLESEADALREELGEDKWVHSFRQAGSKAVAMYESCMKSIQRLQQAIDDNEEEKLSTRIATYKDKSNHYPPSMRRVLELIDIEMKHRSTVNGEILRIQQDVRAKVEDLEGVTANMDAILADFTASRKLRDSVSTVLSARTEASSVRSNFDTPGTSPASSVVLSRNNSGHRSSTTSAGKQPRQVNGTASKPVLPPANRRYSSMPQGPAVPRKSLPSSARLDFTPSRAMAGTAASQARAKTPTDRPGPKPRWNSDTHMRDTVVGHNFKPLTLTTPSPFRKNGDPPELRRSTGSRSSIPVKSPLSRSSAISSPPSARSSGTTTPAQRPMRTLASPMRSPVTPAKDKLPIRSTTGTSPQTKATTPASGRTTASGRHVSIAPEDVGSHSNEESPAARRASRPPSSATNRRSSLLPSVRQRNASSSSVPRVELSPASATGRTSKAGTAGEGRASVAGERRTSSRISGRQSSQGERPGWR
ncbi:karyogamy kar9 [Pyrenophora seminiperda CCB06]|uniref:Karyogamy kar9 n=1 Tax=Pyrenophora seminiperda CCB06 TaxID=1302712 RepID=A0A3M7MC06_9PLEO|nr:karyogamy kar9 [Pyrenophora seminiperda CCB06]